MIKLYIMKKVIFTLFVFVCVLLYGHTASAKVWRVNNNAGVNADFADLPAAITGASAGDTIMLESSATAYSAGTLAKKLVIIGTGYFLSGATVNPNTEWNTNPSTVPEFFCNAGSAGSVIEGLVITSAVFLADDNITLERNLMSSGEIALCNAHNSNSDTIRQNYVEEITNESSSGFTANNTMIYNNIILLSISFSGTIINSINGDIINNDIGVSTFGSSTVGVANFTIQNNILFNPSFGTTVNSNVYFNNISNNAAIPPGNGNVNSVPNFTTTVYVDWGFGAGFSTDGAFALASSSPAAGAGALNGSAVDCGAFGGPAPYVLSGMPSIPSIYALTAPTQVLVGTASITVTVSSASH
jgi:hypothetical protein